MLKKYEDNHVRLNLLKILGIGDVETSALQKLHYEVIVPHLESIVDFFYLKLQQYPEFRQFLSSKDLVDRLKKTQTEYLREMGIDCFSPTYFEERLRVGITHARIGLPLSLYQAAFNIMHDAIISHIPTTIKKTADEYIICSRTLFAVINLDMHLAIEAYHAAQMDNMKKQIDEFKSVNQNISSEAKHDALTGMLTRKYLMQELNELMRQFNDDDPLTVIMADIDHFKKVNDSYGHLVGDEVIKDVSARIRGALRSFDSVGRYGGEEFLIVLQSTDNKEGRDIAERIRQRIANLPIQHDSKKYPVTISMGLTQARKGESATDLIERADQALYNAKGAGRNRVVVLDHEGRVIDTDGRVWNSLL